MIRKAKEGTETYLALFALRDIKIGEELRYDYGVKDLPWRKLKGIHPIHKIDFVEMINSVDNFAPWN